MCVIWGRKSLKTGISRIETTRLRQSIFATASREAPQGTPREAFAFARSPDFPAGDLLAVPRYDHPLAVAVVNHLASVCVGYLRRVALDVLLRLVL